MATVGDIRALGYEVAESDATLEIVGHGLRFVVDRDDAATLDDLANPTLHELRVRRPAPPTTAELENERQLREQAAVALAELQDAADNWVALTNAQKDAALRLTVRSVVRLARLVLRRLEAAA